MHAAPYGNRQSGKFRAQEFASTFGGNLPREFSMIRVLAKCLLDTEHQFTFRVGASAHLRSFTAFH